MLNSDDGMDVISSGREMSQRHQVDGVPFFIINNAITLSGAQAPETFLDAFKQANSMKRIKPISLQTIELTDGGILLYDESFLAF